MHSRRCGVAAFLCVEPLRCVALLPGVEQLRGVRVRMKVVPWVSCGWVPERSTRGVRVPTTLVPCVS